MAKRFEDERGCDHDSVPYGRRYCGPVDLCRPVRQKDGREGRGDLSTRRAEY
jgi:hypothetical protein